MQHDQRIWRSIVLMTTCLLAPLSCDSGTDPGPIHGSVRTDHFGSVDGQQVGLHTLTNTHGLVARIMDYGAIVTSLQVPDRNGVMADIVLGFDTLDEYLSGNPYFGAMVGRVGNRIAGGAFTLKGRTYELARNDGQHHLHGGIRGFDKVVWQQHPVLVTELERGPALRLVHESPNGDEGYPGFLTVSVLYQLTNDNELIIDIQATTKDATPVNIVHHSYWNLAGHNSGDVLMQELEINADEYTPADESFIPTGEFAKVSGTPFDFRSARAIGERIDSLPGDGAGNPGGYDLNFVLNRVAGEDMTLAARAHDPGSGRTMEIHTNARGLQFYSGNFLDGIAGKGGDIYEKHHGFCLETQAYPDSINKKGLDGWPSIVLDIERVYRHTMVHRFLIE